MRLSLGSLLCAFCCGFLLLLEVSQAISVSAPEASPAHPHPHHNNKHHRHPHHAHHRDESLHSPNPSANRHDLHHHHYGGSEAPQPEALHRYHQSGNGGKKLRGRRPTAPFKRSPSPVMHSSLPAFEILFALDVANEYKAIEEDIAYLRSLRPQAKIAVSTFGDKPLPPFGETEKDHCFKLLQPLTANVSTPIHMPSPISKGNWPQAQLEALLRGSLAKQVGWTPKDVGFDAKSGSAIVRVLMMITNSIPNYPGDALHVSKRSLGPNEILKKPGLLDSNPNALCADVEYPTLEDIQAALLSRNIIPVFILGSGAFHDSSSKVQVFKELVNHKNSTKDLAYELPFIGIGKVYDHILRLMKIDGVIEFAETSEGSLASHLVSALFKAANIAAAATNRV